MSSQSVKAIGDEAPVASYPFGYGVASNLSVLFNKAGGERPRGIDPHALLAHLGHIVKLLQILI